MQQYVKPYLKIGAAVLGWSLYRAAKGKPVWPGLGQTHPGALLGAAETVVLWPAAVKFNLTADKDSSSSSDASTDASTSSP